MYLFGPMFRYERPQKGRYRQFHQLDVEVFGVSDPAIDAEVLDLAWALVQELGIAGVELVVNSVGCPACRPAFGEALVAALGEDVGRLCGDCQRRAATNPLRIFDCKVAQDQPIIDGLPHSVDYLCEACRGHFAAVERHLGMYGFRTGFRTASSGASTTTRGPRSRSSRATSAPRTRSSAAAATTAW